MLNVTETITKLRNILDDGKLRIQPYPYRGVNYYLPHVVQLSGTYDGRLISSWGTDHCLDTATVKAIAEFYERIAITTMFPLKFRRAGWFGSNVLMSDLVKFWPQPTRWIGTTSSGWAVHTRKKLAIRSAIAELIERHVVLKAILKEIPPMNLDKATYEKVMGRFELPPQVNIDFFLWKGPVSHFVVVARVYNNHGQLFSFGCATSIEEAARKSFLEATGMILSIDNYCPKVDLISSFGPARVRALNFTKKENRLNNILMLEASSIPEVDTNIVLSDFYIGEGIFPIKAPFYAVRAICPKLQPLFFDDWKEQYINPHSFTEKIEIPEGTHAIC